MESTGEIKTLTWPGSDVDYCGSRIKGRSCDPDSIDPNKAASDNVKVNFGKDAVEGYILDHGQKFSKKGKLNYGWVSDATTNVRVRKGNGNQLLDNLIIFSPAKESKWCNGDTNYGIACKSNAWKIKVSPGRYNVKITVGDSENYARYQL